MRMLTKQLRHEEQDKVPFEMSTVEQLRTSTFDLTAKDDAYQMTAAVGQKLRRLHQDVVDTSCARNHRLQSCHLRVEDCVDEHDVEVVSVLVNVAIG